MADKDKPGTAATTTESLVDFSKLPADALDKYIDHYGLAQRYPPYPPKPQKKKTKKRSASDDSRGGEGVEGDDDEDDMDSEERASKRIDSNQPITTSTRLRPRSPTASMSHFFPGGGGAAAAAGGRRGTLGGAFDDDLDGDAAEAGGKDWEIPCPSHFFDAQEADNYLATVAGRHFAAQPPPKEGEVVVQFLYRCRTGDKCLKIAT